MKAYVGHVSIAKKDPLIAKQIKRLNKMVISH